MPSSASPNPTAATSSTCEPSYLSALPAELKLEILAWTGLASPRALGNLSSTNRELRRLSESLRWKVSFFRLTMNLEHQAERLQSLQNLPISFADFHRLPELIDTFLPLYGHHVRLLRLPPQQDYTSKSSDATIRYYDFVCAAAIPLLTGLCHLDVSLSQRAARHIAMDNLSRALPRLSKTLTRLTLSMGSCVSGVHIAALLEGLPLLTAVRLSWGGTEGRRRLARAFLSLHHLESLRLHAIPPQTLDELRFSPHAPLSHLDMRNCGVNAEGLRPIIATHQATLISLVVCYKYGPRSTHPGPKLHLPNLRDLSLEGFEIQPESFSASPLHTLRCTTSASNPSELQQIYAQHRSTLKKLRVWIQPSPGSKSSASSDEQMVEAEVGGLGLDLVVGSWIVDEWEEHFRKWM